MIDIYNAYENTNDGYRPNVGIVIKNSDGKVLWARRASHDGWQFPQGGVEPNEPLLDAAFRELYEEVGLMPEQVDLLKVTSSWLKYQIPNRIRARQYMRRTTIIGQKQLWFLFDFKGKDEDVKLDVCKKPEFDRWTWVSSEYSISEIVSFKKNVYQDALSQFSEFLQ